MGVRCAVAPSPRSGGRRALARRQCGSCGMRVSVGPERLLGACLIAKPPRPAWAGVPLIALPPSPPLDEQIVSLSQLALHAQGSPLVLAPRGRKPLAAADEPTPPSTPDSTLAADEAQAPLPRVLKPRKRRKRERAASAPCGPGPPTAPSALCACALCCRAAAYPTPPVSPLRDWDDFRCECASFETVRPKCPPHLTRAGTSAANRSRLICAVFAPSPGLCFFFTARHSSTSDAFLRWRVC